MAVLDPLPKAGFDGLQSAFHGASLHPKQFSGAPNLTSCEVCAQRLAKVLSILPAFVERSQVGAKECLGQHRVTPDGRGQHDIPGPQD